MLTMKGATEFALCVSLNSPPRIDFRMGSGLIAPLRRAHETNQQPKSLLTNGAVASSTGLSSLERSTPPCPFQRTPHGPIPPTIGNLSIQKPCETSSLSPTLESSCRRNRPSQSRALRSCRGNAPKLANPDSVIYHPQRLPGHLRWLGATQFSTPASR